MLLEIVKYGSKVLRETTRPVLKVTPELVTVAENMLETMYKAKGVGLAAPQVGRSESMCVIDVPENCEENDEIREFNAAVAMPLVMFNPIIVATEGSQDGREGCLSFPNMGAPVVRPDKVVCQYVDLSGMTRIISVRGFLARAVMHECDHLRGVLYIDHVSAVEKLKLAKRLQKLATKNGGNL